MSNPFEGIVVAVPLNTAFGHWRLAQVVYPNRFLDLDKQQARYAAHAINQHEALAKALDDAYANLVDLIYEEDEDGHNACFECEHRSGDGHEEDCTSGEHLRQFKALLDAEEAFQKEMGE